MYFQVWTVRRGSVGNMVHKALMLNLQKLAVNVSRYHEINC